jgi:hypothetical protein
MTHRHQRPHAQRLRERATPCAREGGPRDDAFWDEVLAEAKEIARVEDEAGLDLFIEKCAREAFQLIDGMEREGSSDGRIR